MVKHTQSYVIINDVRYDEQRLKEIIESNEGQAMRALIIVYNNQTPHEQSVEHNSELNGVGFTKNDVQFLSSLANQMYGRAKSKGLDLNNYVKTMKIDTNWLSPKQRAKLCGKMKKYWKQVLKHMIVEAEKLERKEI